MPRSRRCGGRADAAAVPKFLYYPDENHWVLSPGNAVIWYETVLAFLAHHVLSEPWQHPALLRQRAGLL